MSFGFYWVERTCTSLIISESLKSLQTLELRSLFRIFHASWWASAETKVHVRGNKSIRQWETESVVLVEIIGECRKCKPTEAGDPSQRSWSPEPRHGGVLATSRHSWDITQLGSHIKWDPSTGPGQAAWWAAPAWGWHTRCSWCVEYFISFYTVLVWCYFCRIFCILKVIFSSLSFGVRTELKYLL